jgi:uncharacterized protein (TIGR02265 family)
MAVGYRETMVGGAVFGMLKLLGPKRMLLRTQKNFRSGNNYTDVRFTEVGPTVMDMWMNEPGPLRHFSAGIIEAGMRFSGAPETRVEVRAFDDASVTYRISWGPGQ